MSGSMQRLGSYELEEKLGTGATADVYKAMQPGIERSVAIKVMHPHVASDADFSERFRREARAMGQLQHPHISRVIDFDASGRHPFIVMEYLAGGSMRDLIDNTSGRLPIDYSVEIVRQLADALSYAHSMGTVHRDIKPANVMFTDAGARHAVLTDFGIARLAGESMTMTGTVLGTPAYIAPEQVRGEGAGPAADQYSLGVMLYELTTGRLPFTGDSLHALMLKQTIDEAPSPRSLNPQISPALDTLIGRAMAKNPADRFPSAAHMRDALDALDSGIGPQRRPATVVATPAPPADVASADGPAPDSSRRIRLAAALTGVAAVIGLAVFALIQLGGGNGTTEIVDTAAGVESTTEPTQPATAPPSSLPAAPAGDAGQSADEADQPAETMVDETDRTSSDTPVPSFDPANPPALVPSTARIDGTLFTADFEHSREAAAGSVYLAWLDNVEGPVAELVIDRTGRGQLVADVDDVLGARSLIITEEVAGSESSAPTGARVFERTLTPDSVALLDAGGAAVEGLEDQLAIAVDHDGFIQDELAAGNLAEARRHGEHLVNILDGSSGSSFGDHDGDGTPQNPGDGVGLRVYAERAAAALTASEVDGLATLISGAVPVYVDIADGSSPPPFEVYRRERPIEELAEQVAATRSALEADVAAALLLGDAYLDPEARERGQASLVAGAQTIALWSRETAGLTRREPATDALLSSIFGPELVETLGAQRQDAARLLEQTQLAIDHVELMQNEIDVDNHSEVRRHAEHVVNIIEGATGEHFGDLDNDGSAQNPGDGIGVLVYLDQLRDRLETLPRTTDAQVLTQAAWLAAVDQIRDGVQAADDAALRIIATDSSAEASPSAVELAVALVAARDGTDADANGVISLFAGEFGAADLGFQAATLLTVPLAAPPG